MDVQAIPPTEATEIDINSFVYLLFGLNSYFQNEEVIPASLRRALSTIAYRQADKFPKTLYKFIELCHQPLETWCKLSIPGDFNDTQPILYDRRLSDEAQEFYLALSEQIEFPPLAFGDIPKSILDNWKMTDLLRRLREQSDSQAAQALYVQLRSFLIEHSWTTLDELRKQSRDLLHELREFYEEIPAAQSDELRVCDRCGLLVWRGGHWQGIKPSFCSDHGDNSPYVHQIPNKESLLRLNEGTHVRTFLPGRLELALFKAVGHLQDQYPDQLRSVERYPGLDTYDLRLTFADDEVWAVDAKDHARPDRLATQIRPFYNEGDLAHTHAFYVIPDARMEDANYREQLEQRTTGALSPNLHIRSLSAFQQMVENKLQTLAKSPRQRKSKQV